MFERIGLFFISYLIHPSTVTSFFITFLFPPLFLSNRFLSPALSFLLLHFSLCQSPDFIKIADFSRFYLSDKQIFINHNLNANFP